MDFDELLINYVGEFGRYQVILYFLLCLVGIPFGFNNMGIVFLSDTPNHWCREPGLDSFNISEDARWNLTLPLEEKDGEWSFSKCNRYQRDFTGWTDADAMYHASSQGLHDRNFSITNCSDVAKWQYDTSRYQSTIVTEWDLVCDQKILAATAASVYMAGLMVGVVVLGQLSDWIGRKVALLVCLGIMVGINIGIAFVQSYILYIILRFCVALTTAALFDAGFVFGMEIVGPSWRVFAGFVIEFFWAGGYIAVAGVAYFVRDWRQLQLALSIPLAALFIYFFIPESPRWLYVKKKKEKADKIVKKMAKFNKKELPESFEVVVAEDARHGSIIDLVRTPRMRMRSLNLFFNWFVNSSVYYGLSLNTSNLGGDPYINFLIAGAVEIPGYILCFFVVPKFGRKPSLTTCMLVGGIALLATLPVPTHLNWLIITLSMIGKFGISMSFGILYVFTAELYPTMVRNVGLGTSSLFARAGGICAPYIGELRHFSRLIPLAVFGAMSVAGGLLALLLPETMGRELPETLEDGENFGLKGFDEKMMVVPFDSDKALDSGKAKEANGVQNPTYVSDQSLDDITPKPAENGHVSADATEMDLTML